MTENTLEHVVGAGAEALILIMIVMFPFLMIYGFARWAARHLVAGFIFIAVILYMHYTIFSSTFSPSMRIFPELVFVWTVIFTIEYILAFVYDIMSGWKHPMAIDRSTLSGALEVTFRYYIIAFLIALPSIWSFSLPLSDKFTNAMGVSGMASLIAVIIALFAIVKTALVWLEKPIDKGVEKVKQLIQ